MVLSNIWPSETNQAEFHDSNHYPVKATENRRTAFSTQARYLPPQSSSFYRKTLNHMKFYFIIMVQMQPSNFHS